jgi:molybdate transport system ATP-binding protein
MVPLAFAMSEATLSVEFEKQFDSPDSPAFRLQVNEQFLPGFTVLFGPSGAGKSTILDCISGLQTPDSGIISIGEQIFFASKSKIILPPQRRRIAYVFQSLALFPHLNVQENISYGLFASDPAQRRDRVERAMHAFHIVELRRRKPRELSGGEKQRVALARSLATDPQILLLDEPLTGLDARLRAAILQDLREWNDSRRIPILYVTHNREEVDAIGECVITLDQGCVLSRGNAREVLDTPHTPAIAQAAGFENILSATVEELRPSDGIMRVVLPPSNCELEVPLGAGKVGDQIKVAIRAGDILLATEHPRFLSARNILPGTVESLEVRGALVVANLFVGVRFEVHVTPGAVRSLALQPGMLVWLILKTHSCHVVSA